VAIAVKMLPALKEEAKRRQQFHGGTAPGKSLPTDLPEVIDGGEAAEKAAQLVGVSATYVKQANRIRKVAPETFAKIESGELTVDKALQSIGAKRISVPRPTRADRIADIRRLAAEGSSLSADSF
jgi:hypothetical protein